MRVYRCDRWGEGYVEGDVGETGFIGNEVKVGLWKYFTNDGVVSSKVNYVNGKRNGKTIFYYENGKIKAMGNYHNNLKSGYWEYYERYFDKIYSKEYWII